MCYHVGMTTTERTRIPPDTMAALRAEFNKARDAEDKASAMDHPSETFHAGIKHGVVVATAAVLGVDEALAYLVLLGDAVLPEQA